MRPSDDFAVSRLVKSSDLSVHYLLLTEVLHKPPTAPQVAAARRAIPCGDSVRLLLARQNRDGGFGVHPYRKMDRGLLEARGFG